MQCSTVCIWGERSRSTLQPGVKCRFQISSAFSTPCGSRPRKQASNRAMGSGTIYRYFPQDSSLPLHAVLYRLAYRSDSASRV